eukprot:5385263-Pyramimonas_sp.AAC.1
MPTVRWSTQRSTPALFCSAAATGCDPDRVRSPSGLMRRWYRIELLVMCYILSRPRFCLAGRAARLEFAAVDLQGQAFRAKLAHACMEQEVMMTICS